LSVWPSHGSARDYAVLRNYSGSPHGLLKYSKKEGNTEIGVCLEIATDVTTVANIALLQ